MVLLSLYAFPGFLRAASLLVFPADVGNKFSLKTKTGWTDEWHNTKSMTFCNYDNYISLHGLTQSFPESVENRTRANVITQMKYYIIDNNPACNTLFCALMKHEQLQLIKKKCRREAGPHEINSIHVKNKSISIPKRKSSDKCFSEALP